MKFNCGICSTLGIVCPTHNSGKVTSHHNGFSETINLVFGTTFCGRTDSVFSGLITHELFHVLGAYHTHLRPDRDKYIYVNKIAIREEKMAQYYPKCSNCRTYNLPYECNSIMHYGISDFSKARWMAPLLPTMISKSPTCVLSLDGGSVPTKSDWLMINYIQRCYNTP